MQEALPSRSRRCRPYTQTDESAWTGRRCSIVLLGAVCYWAYLIFQSCGVSFHYHSSISHFYVPLAFLLGPFWRPARCFCASSLRVGVVAPTVVSCAQCQRPTALGALEVSIIRNCVLFSAYVSSTAFLFPRLFCSNHDCRHELRIT